MPYIENAARDRLADTGDAMTTGELNYVLSSCVGLYWENSDKNYQAINDIIGALEGAKLEFYRRVAVPYENEKMETNGDVYFV